MDSESTNNNTCDGGFAVVVVKMENPSDDEGEPSLYVSGTQFLQSFRDHHSETPDLGSACEEETGKLPRSESFACHKCGIQMDANLENHVLHSEDLPYACDVCRYAIIQYGDKKTSIEKEPSKQDLLQLVYQCKFCPYKTKRRHSINLHCRIHTGKKPYTCLKCDYASTHQTNLKRHMETHLKGQNDFSPNRLYVCYECGYKARQKCDLRKHMRCHTGERPYACNWCSYKCSHTSQLRVHERVHTKQKPFSCEFCKYKSNHQTNLKRHLRKHTGEKPFACDLCDYRASMRCTLNSHLRTHMRKQVEVA